jgi:serine/threonine protein kinase
MFYVSELEARSQWIRRLKKEIGVKKVEDNFKLEMQLGEGKFGKVYKATGKKDKKEYAVKVINKNAMKSEEQEWMRKEIETMRIFSHDNIVRLHAVYDT